MSVFYRYRLEYLFSDGKNNRCRDLGNESCNDAELTVVLEQAVPTEKTVGLRIAIFVEISGFFIIFLKLLKTIVF